VVLAELEKPHLKSEMRNDEHLIKEKVTKEFLLERIS
jgi:hypothetical protein